MRSAVWLLACALPLAALLSVPPRAQESAAPAISWKKTVLDTSFRSEGAAVADVNQDGKIDVLNGEAWYEAPDWKRHEIRPLKNHGNPQHNYSQSFCCWAEDLNHDGYPDLIVIDFPGKPCYWFENPGKKTGHWKQHEIWHSACNETPLYVDLLGTGKRVLVMGWQPKGQTTMGQMAYFTPDSSDPTKPWVMHPISAPSEKGKEVPGTRNFSHGLGVGDVNGDGRLDVICTGGWWEQPEKADGTTSWKFHPANLGEACADMYAYDLTGDGKPDILCSSAHRFGIWAFEQRGGKDGGSPAFLKRDLFRELLSETHAMVLADIDGDGLKDFVTGKRWWSHGRNEPGADWPAMLYWFQASKRKDGSIGFTPRVIDTDSGVGTQFTVADVNGDGLLDVAVSNKKGTFLFEQVRTKR